MISVDRTHSASQVHALWGHLGAGDETQDVVGVGGRVVFVRNTGKLCFATLQEGGVHLKPIPAAGCRRRLCLAEVGAARAGRLEGRLVDLGDFVFVRGRGSSCRGAVKLVGAGCGQ